MKTLLLLVSLAASIALSVCHIHEATTSNRTPKKAIVQFTNVCDECQDVIKKFADIGKDPAKLAELKVLLNLLCHETSYETECKAFVSKLDLFIDKLLPYFKDPEAVCKKFHLCSNPRLEQFHRVGLIYAKKYLDKEEGASDLICEECQFAAHELAQLLESEDFKKEVREFLSTKVCARLGQYQGSCDIVLEIYLPDFLNQVHDVVKDQKHFCEELKLCKAGEDDDQDETDVQNNRVTEETAAQRVLKMLLN
ncbi:saposin precursor [Aphelenchoides avenae]|nr:saposin precursor [Aphelenchus avenae]